MTVESLLQRRTLNAWARRLQSTNTHERLAALCELRQRPSVALQDQCAQVQADVIWLREGGHPPLIFSDSQGEVWCQGRRVGRFRRARLLYNLLRAIAVHGDSLSTAQLYDKVWQLPWRAPHSTHALHASISRLRGQLDADVVSIVASLDGYRLTPSRAVLGWVASRPLGYPSNRGEPSTLPIRGLPPATGELFGREQQLLGLESLTGDDGGLVTVVGPAGVGKTSLVRAWAEVVSQRPGAWRVGWWIDASLATTAEQFEQHVALGIGTQGAVVDRLRHSGPSLLILDNLEQLHGALDAVAAWRDANDQLCIVAVSRRRCELPGERVCGLHGLTVESGAALLRSEGVAEDDRQLKTVSEQVEGNPLALRQLAKPLQTSGSRAVLRSMRRGAVVLLSDAFERSWQLLPEGGRRVAIRTALLGAPADVRLVASASELPDDQVIDALDELLSLHLFVFDGGYRAYREVQAILRRRASEADRSATERGVVSYVQQLAEHGMSWSKSERWARWPHVDAVLHGLTQQDPVSAGTVFVWLNTEPRDRLPASRYLFRLNLILDQLERRGLGPPIRARLLVLRALVQKMAGRKEAALCDARKAVGVAPAGSRERARARYMAAFLIVDTEPETALAELDEVLALDLDDELRSVVQLNRGRALNMLGGDGSQALLAAASTMVSDGRGAAMVSEAGRQLLANGEIEKGAAVLRACRVEPQGPERMRLVQLDGQGTLAWLEGRLEDADECYASAVSGFRALGAQRSAGLKCLSWAAIRLEMGDPWRARELLTEAETAAPMQQPYLRMLWLCMGALADLEDGLNPELSLQQAQDLAKAAGLLRAEPEWLFGTRAMAQLMHRGPEQALAMADSLGIACGSLRRRDAWRLASLGTVLSAVSGRADHAERLAHIEADAHRFLLDPRTQQWLNLARCETAAERAEVMQRCELGPTSLAAIDVRGRLLLGWLAEV